ncbi:MAG: hypothetical protein ACI4MQ_00625 [Candidatus Coproplasma sp.]
MSEEKKYQLSQKQKMLGAALFTRQVSKEAMVSIMMVLENDDQVDDMTWFMGQNPNADENQLVAVAYQIVKDANGGNN